MALGEGLTPNRSLWQANHAIVPRGGDAVLVTPSKGTPFPAGYTLSEGA
jgi:hypothetical protein